jgi:hypothetical protein
VIANVFRRYPVGDEHRGVQLSHVLQPGPSQDRVKVEALRRHPDWTGFAALFRWRIEGGIQAMCFGEFGLSGLIILESK